MLTPDHMKAFIAHPEQPVSQAALEYFSKSNLYENDLTLMPLVLQNIAQANKAAYSLYLAKHFPQTADTVQQLVELLRSNTFDLNIQVHITLILIHSDLSLLTPYMKELTSEPWVNQRLQQRLDIRDMPDNILTEALDNFVKDAYGKYYNNIDTFYGEALVKELGRRRCLTEDQILQGLSLDDDGYRPIYYAKLAGEMQLVSAVPTLCSFLEIDDDLTPAVAGDALVKIGTDDVVSAVRETYLASEQPDYDGIFACGLFGDIKRASSEEALLDLLQRESNITNATLLADALCRLGSVRGIPLVKQRLEDGYDSMLLNLKESLYALRVMAGDQSPEVGIWKRELEEEEQRRLERSSSLLPPAPVVAAAKKVGRNDPCPCGSGKKYKKCCGG